MPRHQRGLMRRCWRRTSNTIFSTHQAMLWVPFIRTARKMGVVPNQPRHDALPPHQKGSKKIVPLEMNAESRYYYKGLLGLRDTHKKGGFLSPSLEGAFTPSERDALMFAPSHSRRHP